MADPVSASESSTDNAPNTVDPEVDQVLQQAVNDTLLLMEAIDAVMLPLIIDLSGANDDLRDF